jgi:hypothetical protein
MLDDHAKDLANDPPQKNFCLSPRDQAALIQLDNKLPIVRDRVAGKANGYHAGVIPTGRNGVGNPMLSDDDRRALADLQSRLTVVRDRVRGVGYGHHTGFYLFGRPGTGKTHTIRETLDEDGVTYEYHHGHLTPMGLFELLEEYPDWIIVLDDVAEILNQRIALQILLAALGNQSDETGVRVVKYRRQGRDVTVPFTGGIILISNLELHSLPLLDALKSRINYMNYDPSDEQILALMRDIASHGWPAGTPKITPAEGMGIADFLIEESQKRGYRVDLRLLVDKAFPDYLQYRNRQAETHWKDLVRATLDERLISLQHTRAAHKTLQEIKEDEYEIIRKLVAEHDSQRDRFDAWMKLTGKCERTCRRRAKEIGLEI